MKILITGGYGQLGTALQKVMPNEELRPTDTDTMDITESAQIEAVFNEFKPEFLVHCAAYTNVDGAEENQDLARKINAQGTINLAKKCEEDGISMIYISTDYVFDGNFTQPIKENEKPHPLSVYGETKLEGEKAVLELGIGYVLRTSWVYGEGNNFVRTMLKLADKMDEIKVVDDQFGRPTSANDLAKAIYDVIKIKPEPGIYNVTGDGEVISWADFAEEAFKLTGKTTKVLGVSTDDYYSGNADKKIAPRPKYSALDLNKSKTTGIYLGDWKESLRDYLKA